MKSITLLLLACLLAGCGGTPPSRYYHMDAGPPAAAEQVDGPVVYVDQVIVAAYADRSPMVVRRGTTEVEFAQFDVWAEPIAGQITSVLADALGNRFGRANVLPTPARRDREPDYRVRAEILRFEIGADGRALLDARWILLGGPDEQFETAGRDQFTGTPGEPDSFDARAAALASTLVGLADRIGDAIENSG